MREFLTDDNQKILDTVSTLIKESTPLKLYQKGISPVTIYLREIIEKKSKKMLLMYKPEKEVIAQDTCFITYQPKGQPLNGFQGVPLINSKQHVVIMLPNELYRVQRRKFPRVETPGNSRATFIIKNKNRLQNCQIRDFSVRGAKLIGEIIGDIKKGDIIEPLTLSLYTKYSKNEEKVNLPEALVARVRKKANNMKEIGISFKVPDKDLDLMDILEVYVQMRKIEDNNY